MDLPEYAVSPEEEIEYYGAVDVFKITSVNGVITATLMGTFTDYATAVGFADTWRGKERPVTT